MSIAKMRTINEALSLIKAADPDTAINYRLIKNLLDENKIRHFKTGKKIILNYDDLIEVINMK